MKLVISPTYDAMSAAAADHIADELRRKPHALLCLPSGESPTGVLRYLIEYARQGSIDLRSTRFVSLDEWVGMDGSNAGSCRHYMDEHFFIPLQIKAESIRFFNARAADPDAECAAMNAFIEETGPIDIMMVGVGLNGHIGLNEPGADKTGYAHHSPLDPVTILTAQKYFPEETVLSEGITLGLRHFLEARTGILIASGSKKAPVIAKALEGPVTEQVPASIIREHANAYVFLDAAAAGDLRRQTP